MAYLKFALPIKGSGGLWEVFYLLNPALFNIPGAEPYLIDVDDSDGAIMAVPIWRKGTLSGAIFKRMRSMLRMLGVNQPGKGGLICRINKESYHEDRKIFYHGEKPKMMKAGIVKLDFVGPMPVLLNHNNCLRVSVNETNGLPENIGRDVAVYGQPEWVSG